MWRPKDWDNPYLQQDDKGDYIDNRVFEAGANAMLEALEKEGHYIDASKYPYGVVLNEVPLAQKLTKEFKGYIVIISDEQ